MKRRKPLPAAQAPLSEAEQVADHAARFAAIIEVMPDLVYFKDRSLRNLAVNEAYCRVIGKKREDILGHTDEDVLPPELALQCRRSDEEVLVTGRAVRTEQAAASGEVFDTYKAPFPGADGKVIGIIGVSRVVTGYKQNEAALRRAEERLLRVIANSPVVLFQVDQRGIFTLSEGHGLKSLGLRPGQVVGRSVFELYAKNPVILDHMRRALAGEAVVAQVEEGGQIFETHYAPQRDAGGAVESVLGVALDITERARATQEIERLLDSERALRGEAEKASRSKDDFLALLSHELRTPMTAMIGWAYLLRRKEPGGPEFGQAFDIIERNMHLLSQIIEDLLDVSKIFTGRMRVDQRSLDLSPILRAAIDVVRPAAQAHNVILDAGTLPAVIVSGDPERLQQVFWNLLSNALKFTPDGGKLMVRMRKVKDGAEVTFTDTGVGIPPEFLPHVFDLFTQAEKAMTREHRGLGLGLAIVRHLVELHGGTVKAESAGPGTGATFTVRLPLVSEPKNAAPAPGAMPAGAMELLYASLPRLDGLRVLVVDDETESRRTLESALRGLGAEASSVASADEGLLALEGRLPDVILCDLAMPGTDGYAFIRTVRERSPEKGGDVPAAALTTQTRVEDRTQLLMAGYQMYLPKPVDPAELAAAVKALARRR
ncbi:MAG: PAS/PAC sensor hybrid histidine kinase [Elusimicrobia bacterium]|nr:MAG: PAS/PAC sensor hybrid histidine kinase [Elusimicrobiota bacterium]